MLTTFMTAVAVLALLFVMMGIKIVHQGYRYTIEHFGRFVRVAEPGFNYVTPFFYRVGRKINMMEQVLDIPGQEIITKDNAMVAVDGVVFFQVLDAGQGRLRGQRSLQRDHGALDHQPSDSDGLDGPRRDSVQARRDQCAAARRGRPCDRESWGVKITRVELQDIRPPQDIVNAMTRQMKAEREKRAVILEARACGSRRSCEPRARSSRRILSAEGARKPRSARPRRASAPHRPRPLPPRRSATRSRAAAARRSITSSPRNMSRRSASSRARPTPRPSCSRSRRRS